MSKWTHPMPVYVTRPTADNFIASFTAPLWLFLLIGVLCLANALLWLGIGLVQALTLIVGAL